MKQTILFFAVILIYTRSFSQTFQWAEGFGSNLSDNCGAMQTDAQGNIYVTGAFQGTVDFDPGPGVHNLVSAGYYDVYVLKLNPSGNYIWAKRMGGLSSDLGQSIAVDSLGNVYTTGTLQGTGDFDPGPSTYVLSAVSAADYSAFITKLDANGNFIWAKNFTSGVTKGRAITVDATGNAYSIGELYTPADFDPGASTYTLPVSSGNVDMYISKLDSSGSFAWAKHIGTNVTDAFSLKLDRFNHLYVHSSYMGTIDFDPGAGVDTYNSSGSEDAFIMKLDVDGNYKWTKTIRSTSGCPGSAITTDANGNIYTTGFYYPVADFDPGTGTYSLTSTGFGDMYVLKLDSAGSFLWAKSTQGSHSSQWSRVIINAMALDSQSSVYVTGSFIGKIDFNPDQGTDTLDSDQGNSSFIFKLNTNGGYAWTKTMGGHNPSAISIDINDNMIVAGDFSNSGDFDPTAGSYTLNCNGSTDFFVLKTGSSVIGIREFADNPVLQLYPNPTNGVFTVVSKEDLTVNITNLMGEVIQTINLKKGSNGLELFSPGVYFITGQKKNQPIHQKVIISN